MNDEMMMQFSRAEAQKAITRNDVAFVEKVLDSRGFIGKDAGTTFTDVDRIIISTFLTFASIKAKARYVADKMANLLIERVCVTVDVFSFAHYVLGMVGDDDADYEIVPVSVKDYISKREFDSTEKFEEEIKNLSEEEFISLLAWLIDQIETVHISVCYPIIKYVRDNMLICDGDLFMIMSCSLKPVSKSDRILDMIGEIFGSMIDDSDEDEEEDEEDGEDDVLPGDDPFADILGALLGFPI